MKRIALHGKYGEGRFTLLDNEDFEYLNKYRWHLTPNGYVRRMQESKMAKNELGILIIYMHREILGIQFSPREIQSDHINHDKLDNRKSNLRICTISQNQYNSRSKVGVSKYKGVAFMKSKNIRQWQAQISVENKRIYLGQFNSELLAAKAYDKSAIEHFGEFALTNFPREDYA